MGVGLNGKLGKKGSVYFIFNVFFSVQHKYPHEKTHHVTNMSFVGFATHADLLANYETMSMKLDTNASTDAGIKQSIRYF